jgi:hypothetical protein
MLATEVMLRVGERGGQSGGRARRHVNERLRMWRGGQQRALLQSWDADRKKHAAERAVQSPRSSGESVGVDSTAELELSSSGYARSASFFWVDGRPGVPKLKPAIYNWAVAGTRCIIMKSQRICGF